jgi:coenzyme PQQ precursor peptide PqqA
MILPGTLGGGRDSRSIRNGVRIMWKKPEFTEMRYGFEVTMYIYNR